MRIVEGRRRRVDALERPASSQAGRGVTGDALESCRAMARYALAGGIPVPAWVVEITERDEVAGDGAATAVDQLVRAHAYLARAVAPALPQTLVLFEHERRHARFATAFGPVKLVRQLMAASTLFLCTFVATSLSPAVNAESGDLFTTSGTDLLLNEAFFLSAAGIGASFAALFQVNRFVAKGTYDPKYDTSYWTRFILGLIAGMVLAELVPVEGSFSRPLLALVGGFSASVVYRVLTRIVETLESFVSGEPPPGAWTEHAAPVVAAGALPAPERLKLAQSLIAAGAATEEGADAVKQKLNEIVVGLVGEEPLPPDGS